MLPTKIPDELPAVLIGDVLIPGLTLRIADSDERFINLVKSKFLVTKLMVGQPVIAVVPKERAGYPTHCSVGTAATVVQVTGTNWPKPFYSLLVTGLCRIRINSISQEDPYYVAKVEQLEAICTEVKPQLEISVSKEVVEACDRLRYLLEHLAVAFGTNALDANRFRNTLNGLSPHLLADIACQYVSLSEREKLVLLSKVDITERLKVLIPLLEKQVDLAKSSNIVKRASAGKDKQIVLVAKSGALNDLLKGAIKNDISKHSEDENETDDKNELALIEAKVEALPDSVKDCASRELSRLKRMMPHMPDYSITRGYLEFIVDLPWNVETTDKLDLEEARRILDTEHYGLDTVKGRLTEFLAVRRVLAARNKSLSFSGSPILCLSGPPGVGKTSVARTLAEVMGRKFQRISLGGVCDHADIRGHRRTYVGAMPGRILQAIKAAGSRNPVILLDEVEKTTPGIHGDPAAALLEVLDSEQNHAFVDHYLNIPFDLSQVIFITTANSTSSILPALLDRMEVINVPGYTSEEKIEIVEGYLLPKQLARHGLKPNEIVVERDAIEILLSGYTKEAGVRQMDRVLETLCRRICAKLANNDEATEFVISSEDLVSLLGPPRYKPGLENEQLFSSPGACLGLAWTPMGGEVMHVEVSAMPGDGTLHLTGQLGDVIKESALLALSWIRSRLGKTSMTNTSIALDPLATNFHVHLPSGAVAKDGPSAGLAILASLVSLFAQTPTHPTVAVTGEITLRGYVLPVGGIREKISAAKRYGVKTVVLPSANQVDVADVPEEVRQSLQFVYVRRVEAALAEILDQPSIAFSNLLQLTNSHL